MAAEVGHLELAHDYAYEAALVDLRDLHHNSRDGLHMASLAGAWIALIAGFGGLRDHGGQLTLDPALPTGITRLCFNIRWHGVRLRVRVDHEQVVYSLHEGDDGEVAFHHDGEQVTVTTGKHVAVADTEPAAGSGTAVPARAAHRLITQPLFQRWTAGVSRSQPSTLRVAVPSSR
jgi:trehalose/maltose hydrolase-like predicted phosphorylase